MQKTNYEKIKELLPALTAKEKTQLKGLINLQLKHTTDLVVIGAYEDNKVQSSIFFNTLVQWLNTFAGTNYLIPDLAVLKKRDQATFMLVLEVEEKLDHMMESFKLKKTRKNKRSFHNLYCSVVGEFIDENLPIPVTLKNILKFRDSFPSLLDRAYPGYARSGLLNLVIAAQQSRFHNML